LLFVFKIIYLLSFLLTIGSCQQLDHVSNQTTFTNNTQVFVRRGIALVECHSGRWEKRKRNVRTAFNSWISCALQGNSHPAIQLLYVLPVHKTKRVQVPEMGL
jgi:hypothetical protein